MSALVVVVLWLKRAFLAMVAVTASTFLSFSVASLMAFGTFLVADTTDAAGLYWFDGWPAGAYTVRALGATLLTVSVLGNASRDGAAPAAKSGAAS